MRQFLFALLVVWAGLYLASFIHPWTYPATGDGFTRGLNRVAAFFGWQMAAGMVAFAIWLWGRKIFEGVWLWMIRAPILLALALICFILVLILWANVFKPAPGGYTPPGPVAPATEPVEPPSAL